MEVKYTNFNLDPKIYGKNELVGLYDATGNFIYENFYDIREMNYNKNLTVNFFLRFPSNKKNRKIIFDMLSEFEINKELQKRPLKKLSSSELIKVLIIKVCLSSCKTIILDSIDTYLNNRDLNIILKTIKNHLLEIDKNVIFTTANIDNIIALTNHYIIAENGKITYNGNDFEKVGVKTEIARFTDLANAKGAKLKYYKDSSDLLKAIYRSVKK